MPDTPFPSGKGPQTKDHCPMPRGGTEAGQTAPGGKYPPAIRDEKPKGGKPPGDLSR